jgi:hypothetical protein
MDTVSGSRVQDRLSDIRSSLHPKLNREQAIAALDELFRGGSAPDPQPEGFKRGDLITTSVARPADATVRAIAAVYMPWLGKSFDPSTQSGVNILKPSAKGPMSVLWRNYTPERAMADRLEAFPFRTRIESGALDPDVQVLKIDYDFETNPDLIIRRILDELVQIDTGLYLGKILFRTKKGWHPIGFFSLQS